MFQKMNVIQLDKEIQDSAIKIRRSTLLKLPDSIISATALTKGLILVTDDGKLQNRHVGEVVSLNQRVGGR